MPTLWLRSLTAHGLPPGVVETLAGVLAHATHSGHWAAVLCSHSVLHGEEDVCRQCERSRQALAAVRVAKDALAGAGGR